MRTDMANPKNKRKTILKVDSSLTFKERVLKVVASIPKGKTMSYAEVAAVAGSPGAFRAVGTIMSHNWDPKIPCHRVVHADGTPGQYNRGARNKIKILRKEGAIK